MKLSQLMTLVRDKAVIAMIDNLLASLGRVALSRPPSPHSTISEIISGGLSAGREVSPGSRHQLQRSRLLNTWHRGSVQIRISCVII